jgi:hypothetical protein
MLRSEFAIRFDTDATVHPAAAVGLPVQQTPPFWNLSISSRLIISTQLYRAMRYRGGLRSQANYIQVSLIRTRVPIGAVQVS